METYDAIMKRRSVRKFTDRQIAREDVERLIEAAMWAPSATNRQPWFFLALTKGEDIDWLCGEMSACRQRQLERLESRFPDHPDVVQETLGFLGTLGGARTVVLAFLLKPDYGDFQSACIQSVAAAIENLLLAAEDRGISSCWVEDVKRLDGTVQEHFDLEVGPLIGCVALGYAAYEPKAPARKPGRFEIR